MGPYREEDQGVLASWGLGPSIRGALKENNPLRYLYALSDNNLYLLFNGWGICARWQVWGRP